MTGGSVTGNEKYAIQETEYDGEVFAVGHKIPYKAGNGFFREVVIRIRGLFNTPAYVPVTLFGLDAGEVDETKVGCLIRVTGRLSSRQYEARNGNIRWALGMAGTKVELINKTMPKPDQEQQNMQIRMDIQNLPDDIPF